MSERLVCFLASRWCIILAAATIEVLAETVTSLENVRRAAELLCRRVQVEETGDEFRLALVQWPF